jgi:hypothetical protein
MEQQLEPSISSISSLLDRHDEMVAESEHRSQAFRICMTCTFLGLLAISDMYCHRTGKVYIGRMKSSG